MSLEESWRDLDPHHPSEYDEQSPEYWEKKAIIVEKEYPEPAKREHPGHP